MKRLIVTLSVLLIGMDRSGKMPRTGLNPM